MPIISAGFGRESLLPDFSVELSGFAGRRGTAQGVYDDIHVTSIVVRDGKTRLALVVAELVGIDRDLVNQIKQKILQETGIRPENALICCTHTHSAPAAIDIGGGGAGRVDQRYADMLKERVTKTVIQATISLSSCQAFYGEVPQLNISVNRREKTAKGVKLGVNEEGPRDELVRVLSFRSVDGKILGGISNFGCHPYLIVARPEHKYLISGDFPHWAVADVESSCGGTFMHMNGAGADICARPISESPHPAREGGKRYADRIKEALNISKPISISPFAGIISQANLPLKDILPREKWVEILEKGKKELAEIKYEDSKWSFVRSKVWQAGRAICWLDSGKKNILESTIQMLRLGNICIAGLEHEVCIEVGEAVASEIRKICPRGTKVLIASQANGCLGYIPSNQIIEEGGYETEAYFWYGQPAAFAHKSSATLAAKARVLARKLFIYVMD
jgi:hypothetical protein